MATFGTCLILIAQIGEGEKGRERARGRKKFVQKSKQKQNFNLKTKNSSQFQMNLLTFLSLLLITITTLPLCLAIDPKDEEFISDCADHERATRHMTSISVKQRPFGTLRSHNPANESRILPNGSAKFDRIVCQWRILFDEEISVMDDLLLPPKTAPKLFGSVGFQMPAEIDNEKGIQLMFDEFDIDEQMYDINELDDPEIKHDADKRCSRNFLRIFYIDAHLNKQFLGKFCGRVAIPHIYGEPGRNFLIDVELNDPPKKGFTLKYKVAKAVLAETRQCSPPYVPCPATNPPRNATRCIPQSYLCDSFTDCFEGEDERQCSSKDDIEKKLRANGGIVDMLPMQTDFQLEDSGCGTPRHQTGSKGYIKSMNYPKPYLNSIRCVWYIAANPDTVSLQN